MPQNVDIEGVGIVEFPDGMSPEEITRIANEKFRQPEKVSGAESFALGGAESVIPSFAAAAGAAGAEMLPTAHLAPPYTEIVHGLGGAVVGGMAGSVAQEQAVKAVLPEEYEEFKQRRQLAAQQHPWYSWMGEMAGAASAFQVRPFQPFRVAAKLPALIRGTATKPQVEEAIGTAVQAGFGIGQAAIHGERDPVGLLRAGAGMMVLGNTRWKGLRPSLGVAEPTKPPAAPEVMEQRQQTVLQKAAESGKNIEFVPSGDMGTKDPGAIAAPKEGGGFRINLKNLHEWLDNYLPKGYSEEKAIENLINHETVHEATPKELADAFEASLTKFQKWSYRRRYQGPFPEGTKLSGTNLGKEALRFEYQLAAEMEPSEYLTHTWQEKQAVKMLTVLDKAANLFRSRARTASQKAMVERAKANVEAALAQAKKGAPDALESKATQPVRDVRTLTGEGEGPVSTEVSGAKVGEGGGQAGLAQEAQVPLTPDHEEIISGLKKGEKILESGVRIGKKKYYGPHHPGILEKIGGKELSDKYATKESRNISMFGYRTNLREWVPRTALRLKETGKMPHSDDVPSVIEPGKTVAEQAPPAAPTEGAQPVQATTGLATTPPVELTTGGPAAEAKVSKTTEKVKIPGMSDAEIGRLDELNDKVLSGKFTKADYDELINLSKKLDEAEAKAGTASRPQGEAPAMTLKKGGEPVDDVRRFVSAMKSAERTNTREAVKVGMSAKSIADLDHLLEANNHMRKSLRSAMASNDLGEMSKWAGVQFPREAIEAAVDFGSNGNKVAVGRGESFIERPLDWRKNPEVARWIVDHADEIGFRTKDEAGNIKSEVAELKEVEASLERPAAMTLKAKSDRDYLRRQYPNVKWSERQGGPGWYLVSPGGKIAKIDMDHDIAIRAMGMSQVEAYNQGWARARSINTPNGPTLYVGNVVKPLTSAQKAALINHGIENNLTVIDDSKSGTTVGAFRERILHDAGEAPAMSLKGGRSPEEEVVARVIASVGGVGTDKAKLDIVRKISKTIMSLPREQWDGALTQFHSEWKKAEIETASQKMAQETGAITQEEKEALVSKAQELTQKLSAENIEAVFGPVDRAGAYRSALYVLNKAPQPIPEKPRTTKTAEEIAVGGKPVSQVAVPRYNVGDYKEFWEGFHERHPNIPEWVAHEVWNNAVDDFLNNASGDKLRTLLRPARLERKYLGERAAQRDPTTGELDISMLRPIPDPDPNPIIADMVNSPSPDQALKFRKFWESRDITPEQAIEELNRLRELETQEMRELVKLYPQMAGMVKTGSGWVKMTMPEFEAYLEKLTGKKREKGKVWQTGSREPELLTKQEMRLLEQDRMKGRQILAKRRQKVISDLKKWYTKGAKAPEKSPMRRTVGLDDIWFETKEPGGAYAEYTKDQGQDKKFLSTVLGRGSIKGVTGTTSRFITWVVDPKTGDWHGVSTYVREGEPRFYNPAGLPGSKVGDYIDLTQLLARWRVAASMLVRDPVYNFHQVYRSEPGNPGEAKFKSEIGDVAKSREESSNRQWMKFVREAEAERAAERERIRQERFFGGVREEEVTGEAEGKLETTAEAEAAAGEAEPTTSREEEAPLSVREQIARMREAEGRRPWEEGEEWRGGSEDIGGRGRTEAAMQTWYAGKGRGAGALGLFQSDLRHLAEDSLVGAEAQSLYELMHQHKVAHPMDMERMLNSVHKNYRDKGRMSPREISALYALDKIAERIKSRMENSAYEKAKTKHLPEIPKDTEYVDMTDAEKEAFKAREDLKYRALLRTYREVYDIAQEIKSTGPRAAQAAAKGIPVSEDVIAFGERALDRYGDTARRDVESAALSAQRAPEESGARTLLAGSKFGGAPRTVIERRLFTSPREGPAAMLPPGTLMTAPPGRPEAAFPPGFPTSQVGGPKFTGIPPQGVPREFPFEAGAPEMSPLERPRTSMMEGQPVQETTARGYVPRAPSRMERLTMPMEQAEQLLREERPGPLREKGTEQFVMRKIMEQSEGFEETPAAMTLKGTGVARRYREEMRAQGRTTYQHEDQPVIKKADLIARGRELVINKKINPEKEMAQFERTGYLGIDSTPAFRYWDYRLQSWADSIAADPKYGQSSPEYKEAEAISARWKNRMDAASGQMFARTGHALQGWNQIGPDDMRSTTFVRRFLKKSKAKERGVEEGGYDLTEEDEANVQRIVKEVGEAEDATSQLTLLVGQEMAKAQDVPLDPGQKQLVTNFDKIRSRARAASANILGSKKPPPGMAMKGKEGELPELDAEQMDALGNIGFDVMAELSKAGGMTDAAWLAEMKRVLNSDEVGRPDLEPYLPKVRAVSEQIRDAALNNYIGTGDATKDARNIFTRKRPPIEESVAAIHRALQADPSGENITPAEAYHVWNYIKTRFLEHVNPETGKIEPILDFQIIREKGSAELAIKDSLLDVVKTPYPQLRLFRAISSNRTMRKMTDELVRKMHDEARIKGQALNWLKNQEYPGWLRVARFFPRVFFFDKILGHGFVPMITHAPSMIFNPRAWSVYFGTYRNGKWVPGAWQEMYRMGLGTKPFSRLASKVGMAHWEGMTGADYHAKMVSELVLQDRFQDWKRAGLQLDPFKYTDDYQIAALQNIFGKRFTALTGGRGFDALKTLRYAMAEKWYKSLPEHLQNRKSMELISDSVNHATGIVKTRFHESLNWAMFAPKLEASRWAYIFKDTVKAADYVRNWKTASLEQRAWAVSELKQKASVFAWYAGMLALNQAFLAMTGSKEKINGIPKSWGGGGVDPKKPDFLQFKVAGFRVGLASPFIGMIRLFANAIHAAAGERTKFEKLTSRQRQLGETLWQYGRGKMSPLASFSTDIVTQEDFARRKLPWSTERPTRRELLTGRGPYGTKEYLFQTFAPIPIEEAIRETFKSAGMKHDEATRWLKILTIAGGMGATGARIADYELDQ